MGRKKEVIDTHGEGTSGISDARPATYLPVSRGEAIGEALISVGNGCLVKITAYYHGIARIAVD